MSQLHDNASSHPSENLSSQAATDPREFSQEKYDAEFHQLMVELDKVKLEEIEQLIPIVKERAKAELNMSQYLDLRDTLVVLQTMKKDSNAKGKIFAHPQMILRSVLNATHALEGMKFSFSQELRTCIGQFTHTADAYRSLQDPVAMITRLEGERVTRVAELKATETSFSELEHLSSPPEKSEVSELPVETYTPPTPISAPRVTNEPPPPSA